MLRRLRRPNKFAIATTLSFALVCVVGLVVFCARSTMRTVHESYAQWGVALMIIGHMRDNDGAWPRSWDDLRPYQHEARGAWEFEELPAKVTIDFGADPVILAKAAPPRPDRPPFRVVSLKNGSKVHYQDREPNQMIWDYLVHGAVRP